MGNNVIVFCVYNLKATGLDDITIKQLRFSVHVIADLNCSKKAGIFNGELKLT